MNSDYNIKLSQNAITILEHFLFSNEDLIEPMITPTGITYPLLTSIGSDISALNELVNANILKVVAVDRLIKCPNCGSVDVRLRLKCPKCGSFDLENKRIIQHKVCGFTDVESAFKVIKTEKEILYECPKCKLFFSSNAPDYGEIGKLYECQKCLYRTNNPSIILICKACDANFLIIDAQYQPVYAYKINREMLANDMIRSLAIESFIRTVANKLGINVIKDFEKIGSSGIVQKFTTVLEKNSKYVAITFTSSPDESDAIALLIKATDSGMKSIILSTKKVSDYLRNMCKMYDSQIIEGSNKDEVKEKLEEILKRIFT